MPSLPAGAQNALQREDLQAGSHTIRHARQTLTVPVKAVANLWCDVCQKEGFIEGVLDGTKSQYLSRAVLFSRFWGSQSLLYLRHLRVGTVTMGGQFSVPDRLT